MCKDTQKEMNIQREVKKSNVFNENILFHAQNRLSLQAKHLHLYLLVNRKRLYLSVVCLASTLMLSARTYFVAPNGSDEYRGNIAHPFASLNHAVEVAQAGDTVFFRQGIYHISESTPDPNDKRYNFICHFTRSGRQDAPIVFTGYKNERAVFDMSAVRPEKRRVVAFLLSADYLVFRQLEIIGVQVTQKGHTQSECIRFENASHCVIDNCSFHDGMAIGIYMIAGSDNLILNCDAYNNFDAVSDGGNGGNVDGFGAHLNSAKYTGNVFRGCRAWWNSDDGFDLINCLAPVIIEDCVAFYNGYRPGTLTRAGDGTGFKAGGFGMKPHSRMVRKVDVVPCHIVRRSIAYKNKNKGFYTNHHLGGVMFTDNIAISNPRNYSMICRKSAEENVDVLGYGHIVTNNISIYPYKDGYDYTDYDPDKCTMKNNVTEKTMKKGKTPFFDIKSFNPEDYIAPRK